ncbi:LysE family translocator [Tabrizicola sp.]|uniref:LysE family translocator n=1 Tax=Tabrizicola sp. TaxID=2005166 RepID=UPI003F3CD747
MDLTALLLFAGALALNAGTPGPSIAALVSRVLARGPGSVMPLLVAMWIGEAIWLSAAIFGLSLLAATFQTAFTALKYLGAAYLLWLAWKMWHAPVGDTETAMPDRDSGLALFASGMAITLGNPKIMAFYLALLPAIVDLEAVGVLGWLELTATMLAVLIAIDLTWVAAASGARRFLRSPRAVRIVNRVGATAMGGAAVAIATRD